MIHARTDYNRIQDPALENPELLGEGSTPIAADEPVLVFRAQDKHFSTVAAFYRYLLEDDGCEEMAAVLTPHIERANQWQKKHGKKTPDMPMEAK